MKHWLVNRSHTLIFSDICIVWTCLCEHAYALHTIFSTRPWQQDFQLKYGEESEVNKVTFTVELHVRRVCVNGAEQQRCAAHVVGVVLCFGGLCVLLVRNDIRHGRCVTCHCGSFLWQAYYKSFSYVLLHLLPVSPLAFSNLHDPLMHHKLFDSCSWQKKSYFLFMTETSVVF